MKSILTTLLFFVSIIAIAQVPQALNYQAVARTAQGQLIPAQNITVRFSVLDGTVSGAAVYQETHKTITNNFGLFTLAIGKGAAVIGTFNAVNWGAGEKFLKVEIAPQGNGIFELQGTTQLISVPYALYAEKTRLIAGNAISIINGNTIAANYQAGTGIVINGSTISGNYQPGVGIGITGNTIFGNYQAGSGININGNVISSTGSGSSYWVAAPNGIKYSAANVGIGIDPHPIVPLRIYQPNSGVGNAVLHLISDDVKHTGLTMINNTNSVNYSFLVGGSGNTEIGAANFGIVNSQTLSLILRANGNNNYVSIGSNLATDFAKSRLHVFHGDINIEQIGSGIILKSPNGNCWRVTIDNTGNFVRTATACP